MIDGVVGGGGLDCFFDCFVSVFVRKGRRRINFLPVSWNASYDEQVTEGGAHSVRLLGVVSVVPSGIVTDVVDHDLAHHAVAAGDFDRQAGKQKHGVKIAGIRFAPHESFHAAHRCTDKEVHVIYLQSLGQK